MRTFSAAFFGGTLLLLLLPSLPAAGSLLAAALLWSLITLLTYRLAHKRYCPAWLVTVAGGVGAGVCYALLTAMQVQDTRLPAAWEGQDVLLSGTIASVPEAQDNGVRFLLEVRQADFQGRLRVVWYGRETPVLRAGERWQLLIRSKRPNGFLNRGGFDYEKWLFAQRISGNGYVRKSAENRRLEAVSALCPDNIRQHLKDRIADALGDSPVTGMVQGLAVAHRRGITLQQWDILRMTGTSHLLAISGLHIGMVAGFGFLPVWLLWRLFPSLYLWMPVRIAGAVLGSVLACGYALLAGFTLPTQRALVMVLVLLLGLLLRRQVPFSVTFALALLLVLLVDPLAGLSAGFWLSFMAVALLVFLGKRRYRPGKGSFFWLQLGLSLGMLPLTAGFFGMVSLVSPLANLVAIPFITLLVAPLVLLGVLLTGIFPWLAALLWQLAGLLLGWLMLLLERLAGFELSAVYLPLIPLPWLLLALLGFVLLCLPRGAPGRWLGLVLLLPLATFQPARPQPGAFRVSVLDVGQGLASVVQTANHVLVFDTGPRVSSHFDTGELVMLPWLRGQGVTRVDRLVVSHADNDHRGGARAVLAEMPVDVVMTNTPELLNGFNPLVCKAGQQWRWDGVEFSVLHPDDAFSGKKKNDRSCVLRIRNEHHAMLLTADIERPAEKWLLQQSANLSADVLLAPHHGSKTSSSPAFIHAVAPKLAIITSGYRNRFNHPHPSVSKRYQARDIALLNTAEAGELIVDFPVADTRYQVKTLRATEQRFWHRVSKK